MTSRLLFHLVVGYALLLAVVGVGTYVWSARRPLIALVGGIGGGLLLTILGWLYHRRVLWSRAALVTAVTIFTASFVWRSLEALVQSDNTSALILGLLAIVSLPMFIVLYRMTRL
ncbi:MAG: hypothetical protein RML15_03995 [Bacteroidota bacterium]|nr:hypothetical protein [Candidatus Kapabacteria bacterium]MCS7302679.1 hypothetical protein [Candidatus Kapabacteria bacterium]MCX7936187.1 hypothetical protein [Chlorobiota bacterium]MDW8074919.1 hypothetical protein [Bacteroidota bacterium]MDW8271558.1 hypothetical protein [Bacteroidota bacterium]